MFKEVKKKYFDYKQFVKFHRGSSQIGTTYLNNFTIKKNKLMFVCFKFMDSILWKKILFACLKEQLTKLCSVNAIRVTHRTLK